MRGGFLGVDVFFVLSGYLITGQLTTRWVLGDQVGLGSFWMARARRLLPGLGALLLGTTTAVLILDRSQVVLFRGDVTAAATYSSNWWYIFHQRSYFVAAGRPPLLEHLWSLAVEEQFYLVWPLVVACVVLLCKGPEKRLRVLIGVALSIALASSLVMGLGSALSGAPEAGDPSRWYFGSDSHIMGLLIGASLALWRQGDGLGAGGRVVRMPPATGRDTVIGVSALLLLLYALSQTDEFSVWLYRWGFVAVSLLAAVVIAVATRSGPLAAVLSPPILRLIGNRSYALYLWHWPVACFTRPGVDVPLSNAEVLVVRLGLTFLLAEASYRWIERPVRQRGWQTFWRSVASSRIGSVRAPTIITVFVTALVTGVMMPATASPAGANLAAGGTVYVSRPGQPGSLRISPGDGRGGAGHGMEPSRGQRPTSRAGSARAMAPPPYMQRPTTSVPGSATEGQHGGTHAHRTAHGGAHHRITHHSRTHHGKAHHGSTRTGGAARTPTRPPRRIPALRRYNLAVYGDSVPLGAIPDLAATFRSVTNDATIGVQAYTLLPELTADASSGILDSDIVLIHTGDNGVISRSELAAALHALSGAIRVILAVPYVPREWEADNLSTVASVVGSYPNVRLLPWDAVARHHPEYLWSDSIHLTPTGERAYAQLVASAATAR
jgi:peptidoglycan/LPS O-acetylase OafA/YrhL